MLPIVLLSVWYWYVKVEAGVKAVETRDLLTVDRPVDRLVLISTHFILCHVQDLVFHCGLLQC